MNRRGGIQDAMKQTIINNASNNKIVEKTSTADHVYYNIAITNTSPTDVIRASYNQSRTTAILDNPSDYYCTIQRFTVPLQQVPIFVFLDNTYSVTMSYDGNDYKQDLVYVAGYSTNLSPSPPDNRFVYSYNQFIDSINNGFGDAMVSLIGDYPLYNSGTTYALGNNVTFVVGLITKAYKSLTSGNVGNTPNISPTFWLELPTPLQTFNSGTTYTAGQSIKYDLSGIYVGYTSINDGNLGHTPNTSPTYWAPITTPYMEYNPDSQLISLVTSTAYHNVNYSDQDQPLKIWFNTILWNFFTNFEKIYNGNTPAAYNTNGKNYNIIIKPTGINNAVIPAVFEDFGVDVSGYRMTQEFVSLYDWNSLRNIVFFTSAIPIRSEGIPADIFAPWNVSTTYNSGVRVSYNNSTYQSLVNNNVGNQPDISPSYWSIASNIGSSASLQPILTDFQLSVISGTEARSYAQYVPTSEYRLIDMTGTTPLNNIDIQVYWQDKFRTLYPLYINPLDSLDVKILFRRKTVKGNISYYN